MTGAGHEPRPSPARAATPSWASRRRFLAGALAVGATIPLAGWGPPGCSPHVPPVPPPPPGLPSGLFRLGVASGDPLFNSVVIWTRLAPVPLQGGGMPAVDVPVRWELSSDERFRGFVRRGDVVASPGGGTRFTSTSPACAPERGTGIASSSATRSARSVARARLLPGDTSATACGSSSGAARTGSPATGLCGRTLPARIPIWSCTSATTSTREVST